MTKLARGPAIERIATCPRPCHRPRGRSNTSVRGPIVDGHGRRRRAREGSSSA
jgi:hypothetical protein